MISTLRIHYAIVVFALLLTATPAVHAVVSTIDATVTAEIEEYDGIEMVNFDSAFEDLDNTTGNLPLMVEVEFMQAGTAEDVAGVSAITTFNDPRLSQIPDPNEFGIDVTAFSESSTLWYTGLSKSTETRTITFTPLEIGEPVGTELLVSSQFFVDGIVAVWGELENNDLSDTQGEFWLNVKQKRQDNTQEVTVLQASLKLTGQADGTAILTTTGELSPQNVTKLDMTTFVTELGPMQLVIIPNIAIPYLYYADVDEEFTLKAEIEGKIKCQPGTGASVALGVPLLELVDLVSDVTGAETGSLFEEALLNALQFGPPPTKPLVAADGDQITVVGKSDNLSLNLLSIPFCGQIGIESMLLLTFVFVFKTAPLRRRDFFLSHHD